jgi:hypothetical protein
MNLPRLLEDWGNGGSVTLTLNTSIVNLFASTGPQTSLRIPAFIITRPPASSVSTRTS